MTLSQKYEIEVGKSPEIWTVEKFLKENAKKLQIREVARISQKQVAQSFAGEGETIEFELIIQSDGSIAKGAYTVTKNPKTGEDEGIFSLDLSGVTDPEKAQEIINQFNESVIQTQLKFHPGGEKLQLVGSGPYPWRDLMISSMINLLETKYAKDFQEKGIEVHIGTEKDLKLIVPLSELESEESAKRGKSRGVPQVPHGAPGYKPKGET